VSKRKRLPVASILRANKSAFTGPLVIADGISRLMFVEGRRGGKSLRFVVAAGGAGVGHSGWRGALSWTQRPLSVQSFRFETRAPNASILLIASPGTLLMTPPTIQMN
jgi:hypothetical protein